MAIKKLVVQVVVGTPEDIASGKGESALTLTASAARLGVSEGKLRHLVADGILTPVAKLGRLTLFRERDIMEF